MPQIGRPHQMRELVLEWESKAKRSRVEGLYDGWRRKALPNVLAVQLDGKAQAVLVDVDDLLRAYEVVVDELRMMDVGVGSGAGFLHKHQVSSSGLALKRLAENLIVLVLTVPFFDDLTFQKGVVDLPGHLWTLRNGSFRSKAEGGAVRRRPLAAGGMRWTHATSGKYASH